MSMYEYMCVSVLNMNNIFSCQVIFARAIINTKIFIITGKNR